VRPSCTRCVSQHTSVRLWPKAARSVGQKMVLVISCIWEGVQGGLAFATSRLSRSLPESMILEYRWLQRAVSRPGTVARWPAWPPPAAGAPICARTLRRAPAVPGGCLVRRCGPPSMTRISSASMTGRQAVRDDQGCAVFRDPLQLGMISSYGNRAPQGEHRLLD
jgi:hypothetical protein